MFFDWLGNSHRLLLVDGKLFPPATIGKTAVGIRVGDENGDRISFMNAVGRTFSKIISALILLIGYIMMVFDDRNQALHDKIASTVVYYG